MAELPLDQAIPRLKENEDRVDVWVNDPLSVGYYETNTDPVKQVKTIPQYMEDLELSGGGGTPEGLIYVGIYQGSTSYVKDNLLSFNNMLYRVIADYTSIDLVTDLADGSIKVVTSLNANDNFFFQEWYGSSNIQTVSKVLHRVYNFFNYLTDTEITDVKNNTASINLRDKLAFALSDNPILFLPNGTYRIDTKIIMNGNSMCKIIGESEKTILDFSNKTTDDPCIEITGTLRQLPTFSGTINEMTETITFQADHNMIGGDVFRIIDTSVPYLLNDPSYGQHLICGATASRDVRLLSHVNHSYVSGTSSTYQIEKLGGLFKNLTIIGQPNSAPSTDTSIIGLTHCNDFKFENVKLKNSYNYQLNLYSCYNIRLENCDITHDTFVTHNDQAGIRMVACEKIEIKDTRIYNNRTSILIGDAAILNPNFEIICKNLIIYNSDIGFIWNGNSIKCLHSIDGLYIEKSKINGSIHFKGNNLNILASELSQKEAGPNTITNQNCIYFYALKSLNMNLKRIKAYNAVINSSPNFIHYKDFTTEGIPEHGVCKIEDISLRINDVWNPTSFDFIRLRKETTNSNETKGDIHIKRCRIENMKDSDSLIPYLLHITSSLRFNKVEVSEIYGDQSFSIQTTSNSALGGPSVEKITIRDCFFDSSKSILRFEGFEDLTFQNVSFKETWANPIYLDGNYAGTPVKNGIARILNCQYINCVEKVNSVMGIVRNLIDVFVSNNFTRADNKFFIIDIPSPFLDGEDLIVNGVQFTPVHISTTNIFVGTRNLVIVNGDTVTGVTSGATATATGPLETTSTSLINYDTITNLMRGSNHCVTGQSDIATNITNDIIL